MDVNELEFSIRAQHYLERVNIKTIEDLLGKIINNKLPKSMECGDKTLLEIHRKLIIFSSGSININIKYEKLKKILKEFYEQ